MILTYKEKKIICDGILPDGRNCNADLTNYESNKTAATLRRENNVIRHNRKDYCQNRNPNKNT